MSASNYPREIGDTAIPLNVSFTVPTANIVVFDNIDHPGYAWDVFHYKIFGSTDNVTFTELFNPISVNEPNVPNTNATFTLASFTGTAPTLLNNTITPGLGSSVGDIGYEEYFTFSNIYQYYRFAPSTLTLTTGENETELSAVGIGVPSVPILDTVPTADTIVPEPASFLLVGLTGLLFTVRRRNLKG